MRLTTGFTIFMVNYGARHVWILKYPQKTARNANQNLLHRVTPPAGIKELCAATKGQQFLMKQINPSVVSWVPVQ